MAPNEDINETKIISGRDNINSFFVTAVDNTRKYWNVIVPAKGATLFHYMEDLKVAYKNALDRGVKIRAITEVNKDNLFYIRAGIEYFSEIKHLDNVLGTAVMSERYYVTSSTMYYDEGNIKIENGVRKTQYPLEQIITSNSPQFVQEQKRYFDILWDQAIPIQDKLKQIENLENPQLRELESSYEIQNLLINLLQTVQNEVYFVFPTFEIFKKIQRFLDIISFLESKDRIQAKILVPIVDTEAREYFKKLDIHFDLNDSKTFNKNIEIREIKDTGHDNFEKELYPLLVLFDRNKSISIRLNEVKEDQKIHDSLTQIIDSATYVSGKDTVLSNVRLFDRLWYQTKLIQNVECSVNLQREFVNLAAHELQNPIQPILSLSEIVIDKLKDEEQKKLLQLIIKNATSLMFITEGILELTRIEKDILSIHKEKFDLISFMSSIGESYRYFMQENSNTLDIEIINSYNSNSYTIFSTSENGLSSKHKSKLYHEIMADRLRLGQIIHNLIDNANKYTARGLIKIIVRIRSNDIEFTITDSGKGIDDSVINNLFEKFVTTSKGGTGLGLYLCKKLVEAHGGRISAKNIKSDNTSASFSFSIPNS